jgi:hypothetical protein
MLAKHTLQFWAVDHIGGATGFRQMREIVRVAVRTVAMPVPVARAKIKPGRNGNP